MSSNLDEYNSFLQVISHKEVLDEEEIAGWCDNIFEDSNVNVRINEINNQLEKIGMSIKQGTCELTGEKYWSLVTTSFISDSMKENVPADAREIQILKDKNLFTRVPKNFVEYFYKIYDYILHSDDACISSNECINLGFQLKVKIKPSDAEEFLNSMVLKKYLTFSAEGNIYIGPRGIAEFVPYFKSKYPDLLTACNICKQSVVYGYECEHCDIKIHLLCLSKFVTARKKIICPACSEPINAQRQLENISS